MPIILHVSDIALVILDAANMERISSRDPLELNIEKLVRSTGRAVNKVLVTFGTAEDITEIVRIAQAGNVRAAIDYACRGWSTQPEDLLGMHHIAKPGEVPS